MSKEETKTITQDENLEELKSATPSEEALVEEPSVERKIEDVDKENKDLVDIDNPKVDVMNYLDPSILDIEVLESKDKSDDGDDNSMLEPEIEKFLDSIPDVKEHEVIKGVIVSFSDREVLVDIGFKSEGVVPRSEFSNKVPEIGDEIDVYLVRLEDKRGNIILSKEKADFEKRWTQIRTAFDEQKIIKGTIIKRIKGGMIVDLGTVQAFLPGSQIDIKPITDFDALLGSESEFKIVKFNEMRQNIVLSRKAVLSDGLLEKRQEVLSELEIGMVLEGIVKNITDFGAFIDLGGIDGLLHITDITWGRINHPSDKLSIGEKVSVKVIDFDVEKVRVSLGMKQLSPEPWEQINDKYPVDQIVSGKVVNMMNYGAFVELEEGVEGLIHVSEMSWVRHIKHPSDMFNLGDKVEAKILSVDKQDKKISLGIKQLEDNPWDVIESKYESGGIYSGVVKNLTQFGAFVQLEDGIEGLVHINDMSWTQVIKHPKQMVKKDDKIDVKILEISTQDRKLSLGIKQLEDDPWVAMSEKYPRGHGMSSEVIKILDKGIIFMIEDNVEGIFPIKNIADEIKQNIKENVSIGKKYDVTVIKVDLDYRKIILSMNDFSEDIADISDHMIDDSGSDNKIDIPQEIIDQVKDENN